MPQGLIHLASGVTTGYGLAGLIFVLLAWVYYLYLRHQENIIRASSHRDRRRVLDIILSRFSIDVSNLSQDQQFKLAIAQIHSQRWKIGFWALLAVISAYTISAVSHEDHHIASSSENYQSATTAGAGAIHDGDDSGDVVLPFGLRSISTADLTDEMTNGGQVSVVASGGGEIPREATFVMESCS